MSYMIAPEYRKGRRPDPDKGSEAKTKCSLFAHCEGCPYPSHGFVCWGRDGQCMREIMKKLDKGAEENDVRSGTEQC